MLKNGFSPFDDNTERAAKFKRKSSVLSDERSAAADLHNDTVATNTNYIQTNKPEIPKNKIDKKTASNDEIKIAFDQALAIKKEFWAKHRTMVFVVE